MRTHAFYTRALHAVGITAIAAVIVALWSAYTPKDQEDYYFKVNKDLETFGHVFREVAQGYVDTIDPDVFIDAGINGMLSTLDPYTVFQRGDANDVDLLTTGSYGGVGITVGMRDSMVTITDVIDGYSAQHEGVRIGDRLMQINGKEVLHGPIESLRELTRGEPGSTIAIAVRRDGVRTPITFKLTRDNIRIRSVAFSRMLESGVGYVRLERFSAAAGDEVRSALRTLRADGELRALVLDLRDNPGGLLDAAVDVASIFVPEGSTIVFTRGRDLAENKVYRAHGNPAALGLRLVVLVNGNSASAAEIVAGAVQDLDAGVIMGTESYGKGLVQTVRRLPYESLLKITTARYYAPSGRSIQKVDYLAARETRSVGAVANAVVPAEPTFRTLGGRKVWGHGGIRPDTVVVPTAMPRPLAQLRDAAIFFKFASRYAATMRAIPVDFVVHDSVVRQFIDFALAEYPAVAPDSSSARLAAMLQASAGNDQLSPALTERIGAIRASIDAELRAVFVAGTEMIRAELYREVVARFQSQRERKTATVDGDAQIKAAVALLRSGDRMYGRMLGTH